MEKMHGTMMITTNNGFCCYTQTDTGSPSQNGGSSSVHIPTSQLFWQHVLTPSRMGMMGTLPG